MPGYGRYYNNPDITADSLKNIRLPDKIRCERCNKWKGQSNYAKKRLNDLREKIRNNGPGPNTSQCTLCVPRQVMELKCFVCEKDKGLEDFAKAQRKDPDHARCNDCMKEQLDTEPIEEQPKYHGQVLVNSDSDDDEDSSDDDEYSNVNPEKSTWADSSAGTATGNLIGDFDNLSCHDDTISTSTGGAWTPITNRSAAGGSVAGGSVSGRTVSYAASVSAASTSTKGGFDPMKYGHPRASSSIADSMETNRPTSSTSSKWAKVRAFKPEPKLESEKEDDTWGEEEEEGSSSDDDDSEEEYGTMKSSCRR